MNGIWQRVSAEPAVVTGAVVASVNVVAAFRAWTPTPEQLAAINSALAAIFALIVRAAVEHKHGTPVQLRRARPRRRQRRPARQPGARSQAGPSVIDRDAGAVASPASSAAGPAG